MARKRFLIRICAWLIGLASFCLPKLAYSDHYTGRFTFGGEASTEQFNNETGGSNNNDYLFFSTRFFFKDEGINNSPWEFVTDIRDIHDYFDHLNQAALSLDSANRLQVQTFEGRYAANNIPYIIDIGRFHVPEAGVSGVDGMQFGYKVTPDITASIFGGKNPRRPDQVYYQYNPDDNIAGLETTYQRRAGPWNENFYMSNAFVTQTHQSETDRTYFFHNLIYQWQEYSRVIALLYLDFVPRTYVQTGNFVWQQQITPTFMSEINALGIDVIEYSRRQGILETLSPSPYKEVGLKLDQYFLDRKNKLEFGSSYGVRDADNKKKVDNYLGYEINRVMGKNQDMFFRVGYRKNFVSNDVYSHFYWGYFSRKWEGALDVDAGVSNYTDGIAPTVRHPITIETSISNYLAKELYSTVSLQRASDDILTAYAVFFKFGYRFGNQEVAPVRDGTPPRGQL